MPKSYFPAKHLPRNVHVLCYQLFSCRMITKCLWQLSILCRNLNLTVLVSIAMAEFLPECLDLSNSCQGPPWFSNFHSHFDKRKIFMRYKSSMPSPHYVFLDDKPLASLQDGIFLYLCLLAIKPRSKTSFFFLQGTFNTPFRMLKSEII